jgi:inner membrane protein involved in colicin E2 resistance
MWCDAYRHPTAILQHPLNTSTHIIAKRNRCMLPMTRFEINMSLTKDTESRETAATHARRSEISTAPHFPHPSFVGSQLPILTSVDQSYLLNPNQSMRWSFSR